MSTTGNKARRKFKESVYKAMYPYEAVKVINGFPVYMNAKGQIVATPECTAAYKREAEFFENMTTKREQLLETIRKIKAEINDGQPIDTTELNQAMAELEELKHQLDNFNCLTSTFNVTEDSSPAFSKVDFKQAAAASNAMPHDAHCNCGCHGHHDHNHQHPQMDIMQMINNTPIDKDIAAASQADAQKSPEQLMRELDETMCRNSIYSPYWSNVPGHVIRWEGEVYPNGNPIVDPSLTAYLIGINDNKLYIFDGRPFDQNLYRFSGQWVSTPAEFMPGYQAPVPQPAPAQDPSLTATQQPAEVSPTPCNPDGSVDLAARAKEREILFEKKEKVSVAEATKYPAEYNDPHASNRYQEFSADAIKANIAADAANPASLEVYRNYEKEVAFREQQKAAEDAARARQEDLSFRMQNGIKTPTSFRDACSNVTTATSNTIEQAAFDYHQQMMNAAKINPTVGNAGQQPQLNGQAAPHPASYPEFIKNLDPTKLYAIKMIDQKAADELNFAMSLPGGCFDKDAFVESNSIYFNETVLGSNVNRCIATVLVPNGYSCFRVEEAMLAIDNCKSVA